MKNRICYRVWRMICGTSAPLCAAVLLLAAGSPRPAGPGLYSVRGVEGIRRWRRSISRWIFVSLSRIRGLYPFVELEH